MLATALGGWLTDRGKSFTANSTSGPAIVVNPDPQRVSSVPQDIAQAGRQAGEERAAEASGPLDVPQAEALSEQLAAASKEAPQTKRQTSREKAWDRKEIDLAWDLVVRGLERQPGILGDLRARTGTLLAAAGIVVSVVIGFFATDSSSIDPLSGILLLVGFLPAVLAVKECWLVLHSLDYDDYDTDLMAYENLRKAQPASTAFKLWTGDEGRECSPSDPSGSTSAWRRAKERVLQTLFQWKGTLDKRLEQRLNHSAPPGTTDDRLTTEQLHQARPADKRYRWWRVTLNQRSVRRLRDVAVSTDPVAVSTDPLGTPDNLTAELTSFLGLARKSNWMVIDQLTAAFNNAAALFGIQLLLWIAAAAALYHGAGATPHK